MQKIILTLGLALVGWTTFAQKTEKALHIGNQMPEYKFPHVVNTVVKTIDLTKYRGKYLLIDFWSSSCYGCIEAMPHIQELKDKFRDKLNVILYDSWDRDNVHIINKIINRVRKNKGIKFDMPVALADKNFNLYFPHRGLPHEVIIDPNGEVFAITRLESITDENIVAMLNGKKDVFPLKDDFWDANLPFIVQTNSTYTEGISVSSSLTGPIYNVVFSAGYKTNKRKEVIGRFEVNVGLINLYMQAYPLLFEGEPVIKFETTNPIFQNVDQDPSKTFCYDIIVPPGTFNEEKFKTRLRQDLEWSFNFSFKKEKRVLPCLILRTNDNILKSLTLFRNHDENIYGKALSIKKQIPIYAHHVSITYIPYALNYLFKTDKIIDESGEKRFIDINFPLGFEFDNREKVMAFLHEKGVDISFENREVDCVIVSDKKTGEYTGLN